jgi:peptidoglycan/LPS O-acetylase OafA/YrhL
VKVFRPDIEGLRAVAVILVILAHAGVPWLEGGFIGVDVFFVISGFLITRLLLGEHDARERISLVGFYARRARRILPAATLVIVVTVVASYEFLGFIRGSEVATDAKWAALFAANLHFADAGADYLTAGGSPSPLRHYWSLGVEEQFYLVWPALIIAAAAIAPRKALRTKLLPLLVTISVASYAWSIVQTSGNGTVAFFSPLTRLCELSVGALLALAATRTWFTGRRAVAAAWTGLAGIAASAVVLSTDTAFPGAVVIVPVLATALVLMAGHVPRVLGAQPMQRIGALSYSLYLWHWPLFTIATQRAGHSLGVASDIALIAATFMLAFLTYRGLEGPIRHSPFLRARPRQSLVFGGALVAAAIGLAALEVSMHPQPSNPTIEVVQ